MDTNTTKKIRSEKQNSALHLFFEQLAEMLNDAGLDQRKVLKPSIEIPWTKDSIKEQLWRPIQKAYLEKRSTTELLTTDIDKIYDILNRHLSEKFGVSLPAFPSLDELIWREQQKENL
jgi:hypothetical protein